VRLAQILLQSKVGVCGTVRANRNIPRDLNGVGRHLKKERQGSGVMVQVSNDRTCANEK